ncbi:MAG TPA: GtrA family protein [Chitinophagaceae bacterium]|nr:GtrA family protein [Chitinophagaceae bacterium]
MRKFHHWLKHAILRIVDFFYPPFKNIIPLQTFRYAACGSSNMALNIFIYFITFHYILHEKIVYTPFIAISPHIAAYMISFCISFPIGFYLSMFVVFPESYLRKRIQLLRYFVVVMICILLNYLFLKLFVDVWGWYPTPSLMIATPIIVAFSYLSQRHFSFKRATVAK